MVISNHLQEETRFRTPKLLSDHGIRRAINVLIARGGEGRLPFGVLEVDSPESGQFDVADADFLAGFAGLLGIAIERQHADADSPGSARTPGHADARIEPPRQEQPRIGGGAAARTESERAVGGCARRPRRRCFTHHHDCPMRRDKQWLDLVPKLITANKTEF